MNKKLIVAILILAVLSILLWWKMSNQKKETTNRSQSDFAVKDTMGISRIVLSDKEKNRIELRRNAEGWLVNGRFPARKDAINLLLETIYNMEVKSPVGRAGHNTVVRRLATKSVRVEIFRNESLLKSYFVGGPTQDQQGTYMLMSESDVPFIMGLPGFSGYLSPRFFTSEDLWKTPALIPLRVQEIASVKYISNEYPEQSWELINNKNSLSLQDPASGKPLFFDSLEARAYLTRFFELKYEAIERGKTLVDSLAKLPPREEFSVRATDGREFSLKTFNKKNPVDEGEIKAGAAPPFDPDRFWAVLNNDRQTVLLLQYFVMDPVLVSRSFFTVVKK
jgi:hypothetical protein